MHVSQRSIYIKQNALSVVVNSIKRVTPGRPVGSTALAGFKVSSSYPKDTTLAAGCNVSDERPLGSTLAAGYNVFMSSGELLQRGILE